MTPADKSDLQPAPDKPIPDKQGWWQRNRLPLLALLPLAALAVAASSYRMVTLYRPNEYTQAQRAAGPSLAFQERFTQGGKSYIRRVTLNVVSVSAESPQPVRGPVLWKVKLQMLAPPGIPLQDCQVALVDHAGRVYDDRSGQLAPPPATTDDRCVPEETPGPIIDFFEGKLVNRGLQRPPAWEIERTVALPAGRQPEYVRVAWRPPNYALVAVR